MPHPTRVSVETVDLFGQSLLPPARSLGSNTNSNVIFAPLQQHTAKLIGISVLIILGAQTTGGALGSMLAPAKVIVGCSTAGLAGQEGEVMKKTLPCGLLIAGFIGLVAWFVIHGV